MRSKRQADYYPGFRFVASFAKLFPLLYPRLEWGTVLTTLLFVVAAGNEYLTYHSGTIVGKFYNAFLSHDEHMFWNVFWRASGIYLGQTLVIALISLVSWLLAVSLRKNLVTSLHSLYYSKNIYYNVNCVNNDGIDNPDQRITQDAEKLTSLLAKTILPYFIVSPGVIAFYTYQTWKQAGGVGVGCIWGYFLVGTLINRVIVSPITKWSTRVEKSEGDFRYKHVSVRDNAEESAFYSAEKFEHIESNRFLFILLKNQVRLAFWKFPAQYFQLFFDYYGAVFSYAIQAIPIFVMNSYKNEDPGTLSEQISNNAFIFIYLINSFTRLTDMAMNIGELASYSQRISSLVDYSRIAEDYRSETVLLSGGENNRDAVFSIQDLVCYPPSEQKRRILNGITFNIPLSKSLLISGFSGVGKTSLLRLLKQLWKPSGGQLERFVSYNDVVFLPQNCYLPAGNISLKKQLLFPYLAEEREFDENRAVAVLESLSLSRLLALCGNIEDDVDFEWSEILSPGEQQRLSIARVLLRKPKVVILDEATSGLSVDMEMTVYDLLHKNGIHYISVGHRSSLIAYHKSHLTIKGPDVWEMVEIEEKKGL